MMPTPQLSLLSPPPFRHLPRCVGQTQSSLDRSLLYRGTRHFARPRTFAQLRRQTTIPQRHGTAVEHIPHPQSGRPPAPKPTADAPKEVKAGASESRPKESPKPTIGIVKNVAADSENTRTSAEDQHDHSTLNAADAYAPVSDVTNPPSAPPPADPDRSASSQEPPPQSLALEALTSSHRLETVLQMEPPSTSRAEARRRIPPHLEAPPYVHHFDTYTLVKDLSKGGFTYEQSVTIMKAVRGLLAQNLDVAKDGLVSKSDVENESYLFRAACSELRTEVSSGRQSATDKMRSERAHLQHEVDILSQRVTQETMALKDQLRGMFDDRKMAVRTEQRAMESAIAELNYKITVAMGSDAKGEVEGLRWFLSRRAALAIAGMALLILTSLRYAHYMSQFQQQERDKMEKLKQAEASFNVPSTGDSARGTRASDSSTDGGGETEAMLAARLESGGG